MNFFKQVYRVVKKIPVGKVMTYGQVARVLGTRDARRVGWALHGNSDRYVPCHRVVNKDGQVAMNYGGLARSYAAMAGAQEQKRRLAEEGVEFVDEAHVDLNKYQLRISTNNTNYK